MTTTTEGLTAGQKQLASDIIITATEGGSNYWARIMKRVPSKEKDSLGFDIYEAVFLREMSEPKKGDIVITAEDLIAAAELVSRKEVQVRDDIALNVHRGLIDPEDGGDIDAEAADVVLQVACFTEIVYG